MRKVLAAAVLMVIATVLAFALPSLRRYLKIEKM
jgi:hypothetical protein